MNWHKILSLAVVAAMILSSCDNEDEQKVNVNQEVYNLMDDMYYWYDQMPEVDPNAYKDPVELVNALRVYPPDRWSYVTTKAEFDAYYNQGAYVGFGFGSGFSANNELYITFVFKNSPLAAMGIDRGWQIISIDGQTPTSENFSSLIGPSEVGVSKKFLFKSPEGSTMEQIFTKSQIEMNSVLMDSIYTTGTFRVGYFVLESFIGPTEAELTGLFSKFKEEGINELVVDLRYNGGGEVGVAKYLASLIAGSSAFGKVFGTYYHNDKHQGDNSSITFTYEDNSIPLNRVVFITTSGTASASELVINGLKPHIEVSLVGSKTHGKPVGMYSFEFRDPSIDWVIVPICFSIRNSNNEGDYFDGIPVDVSAADDITHPFGSMDEESLNAAFTHLGVNAKGYIRKAAVGVQPFVGKGLQGEIGAW